MFGKRSTQGVSTQAVVSTRPPEPAAMKLEPALALSPSSASSSQNTQEVRPDSYYQTKSMIFGALIEAIDLSSLSKLDPESAREEIRDIVHEIVTIKNLVLSIAEIGRAS